MLTRLQIQAPCSYQSCQEQSKLSFKKCIHRKKAGKSIFKTTVEYNFSVHGTLQMHFTLEFGADFCGSVYRFG